MANLAEFKQVALVNALRGCQLFAGLPADDLERIAAVTASKQLQKGEYLFYEGKSSHGFYV